MNTKPYQRGKPVILGLCGKAGTGKTTVADILAPMGMYYPDESSLEWDHLFFAMPLYELVSIRRKIQGHKARERQLYEIHNTLVDLFANPLYGGPDYYELVELTLEIAEMPISMNEEVKPRSFLQDVGTMCREQDEDCFVKWVKKMVNRRGADASDRDKDYICVVSDIRMPNEAAYIHEAPNGVVVRFDASQETREARLIKRDGYLMDSAQASHVSENIEGIPDDLIDAVVVTDNMKPKEQAEATKKAVYDVLEGCTNVPLITASDIKGIAFNG